MTKLHAKSPCCRGEIYRSGNRRRQCSVCKKTWRIRQKKTGRKKKRTTKNLIIRYLSNQTPSLSALAIAKGINERNLQRYLERSLDYFLKHTSWPTLSKQGPLILLADAKIKYIEKNYHTFYFMLIRKINENEAVILCPYIRQGTETQLGWTLALNSIPNNIKARIQAVVCDGHGGLVNYAKRSNWIIQRCNFHLIARIQGRRSIGIRSKHRKEGWRIYKLVNHVLTTRDEKSILSVLSEIEEISWLSDSPDLRKCLAGFVKNYEDHRNYLYHPELNLPRTNNTAESLISCVENLNHKARGFCTLSSFAKRIFALIKHRKTIKCNGSSQPT